MGEAFAARAMGRGLRDPPHGSRGLSPVHCAFSEFFTKHVLSSKSFPKNKTVRIMGETPRYAE